MPSYEAGGSQVRLVEIEVGFTYTDGRGATRRVIGEGPHLATNPQQRNMDLVQYELLTKERGPHPVGAILVCTRVTFAAWASQEVFDHPLAA